MTRIDHYTLDQVRTKVGEEIGISDWLEVEQRLIDSFAHATKDPDWIHIDPERARLETPYGGTIAFGFWTLSMLTYFSHQIGMWPRDAAYGLNYGLDGVRWLAPLRIGARIRLRATLLDFSERSDGKHLIRTSAVIEIEGEEKPALVAEWLGLFVPREENGEGPA